MKKKTKGSSTTQVNVTDEDGTIIEYTSKASIEEFIAKGNDVLLDIKTREEVNSYIIPLWNNWVSMEKVQ